MAIEAAGDIAAVIPTTVGMAIVAGTARTLGTVSAGAMLVAMSGGTQVAMAADSTAVAEWAAVGSTAVAVDFMAAVADPTEGAAIGKLLQE